MVTDNGWIRNPAVFCWVGFMRATVLETGQNKNVEQVLTHPPPPTPNPQGWLTGVAPPNGAANGRPRSGSPLALCSSRSCLQGTRVWTQPVWEGGGCD